MEKDLKTYFVTPDADQEIDFNMDQPQITGTAKIDGEETHLTILLNDKHRPYYQDNAISLRVRGTIENNVIDASTVEFQTKLSNLQGNVHKIEKTNNQKTKFEIDLKEGHYQMVNGVETKKLTAYVANHEKLMGMINATKIGSNLEFSGYSFLKNKGESINMNISKMQFMKLEQKEEQSSEAKVDKQTEKKPEAKKADKKEKKEKKVKASV
ncbi:MAG: hypothetical protein ABJH98_17760 [Reichenbachiella sp.]|uniref:hypothetical protein n=1 Tax=Reichenbachiella sp. TaxID=2184521 RepID=UPI00329914AA